MQNRLIKEVIFRSIYLVVSFIAFIACLGFWSIGGGSNPSGFDPYFFTNYFVWTLVMSFACTLGALIEDISIYKSGEINRFTRKFSFLKFCTLSCMIFGLLVGSFFIDRIGNLHLTNSQSYGSIYPAIATPGFWLDMKIFLPFFVCPIFYITMYILFEEKGRSRKLYSKLGIVPPTLFYLTDKIFGIIMKSIYGGPQGLIDAGKYGIANPFFFYDDLTFHQWWWIILWPSIFGVVLVTLNKLAFIISRLKRNEDGKLILIKEEPDEDTMVDIFHPIILKMKAKRTNKQK